MKTPLLPAAATMLICVAPLLVTPVSADIIRVATNGVDSSTCGTKARPCRSISQGIENASDGDRVMVGPGRYGDLNRNGTFGETGEEFGLVSPCFCMLDVNKRVAILSEKGALQTVIDGAGTGRNVVAITASSARFGNRRRGFTVTGSSRAGIEIRADDGVVVAGNLSEGNQNQAGTSFGDGYSVEVGDNHRLTGNVATANGNGFQVSGDNLVLIENVAVTNRAAGFDGAGANHLVRRNVASGNRAGFQYSGSGHRIQRNAVIGNRNTGIHVTSPTQPDQQPATANVGIQRNNIYGNGEGISSPQPNCGILNSSGARVDATRNYWGSPAGPGAEPADLACALNGDVVSRPFAKQEFKVLKTGALTGQH